MLTLRDMQTFLIDMDGVLWEGERPLPGLHTFFNALRACGAQFILATNNASKTPEQYVEKLRALGVAVVRDEILTSAQAAARYLAQHASAHARVFAIGEAGVREALTEHGFILCDEYDVTADYVVCGMDRALSWDKLATATLNIRNGAVFIGTNPDTTLPTERGLTHGNGAILAALQTASGVAPIIMGKPEPLMYQQAMARLHADPATTLAIGDRLETDILGAVRASIHSALVLSGISTEAEAHAAAYHPTWIFSDIAEIAQQLETA